MAVPRLRSPLARAVVPVLGGLAVLALIALATWLIAAAISGGAADTTERLAPPTLDLGSVVERAEDVALNGPLLFPGLNTTSGERSLVVYHEGADPASGWIVYYAYPADRDPGCAVEQVPGTASFTDCDGRRIDVADLAPPESGVRPIVENRERLLLDLRSINPATG